MLRDSILRIVLKFEGRTTVLCVLGRERNIGPDGEGGEGQLLGTVIRMRRMPRNDSS
jgi:hypothetical protein